MPSRSQAVTSGRVRTTVLQPARIRKPAFWSQMFRSRRGQCQRRLRSRPGVRRMRPRRWSHSPGPGVEGELGRGQRHVARDRRGGERPRRQQDEQGQPGERGQIEDPGPAHRAGGVGVAGPYRLYWASM